MNTRELICIGCPLGCALSVKYETDGSGNIHVINVEGNTCPKGKSYGEKEVTNPTRMVTTTVAIKGGTAAMVNVKTAMDIPKGSIFACVKALKDIEVTAPVKIGDVILPNVAGTGVDIVAAGNVLKKCL